MTFNDRVRFVAMTVLTLAITVAVIAGLGRFSYPLFSALAVFEFLLLFEITAPSTQTPRWLARLRWLAVAGVVVLTGIAAWFLLMAIPSGVV